MPRLLLASSSPQRRALLSAAGYEFDVVPPHEAAEDPQRPGEGPAELVVRLAQQKAADVAARIAERPGVILACDTVAELGGEILGKPRDADDARRMLRALRGREHRVLSGLCLWPPCGTLPPATGLAESRLVMAELLDDEIEAYVASGQWQGKAGAFGLQDRPDWIRLESGSESNVIGLPLELLAEMLAELPPGGG